MWKAKKLRKTFFAPESFRKMCVRCHTHICNAILTELWFHCWSLVQTWQTVKRNLWNMFLTSHVYTHTLKNQPNNKLLETGANNNNPTPSVKKLWQCTPMLKCCMHTNPHIHAQQKSLCTFNEPPAPLVQKHAPQMLHRGSSLPLNQISVTFSHHTFQHCWNIKQQINYAIPALPPWTHLNKIKALS